MWNSILLVQKLAILPEDSSPLAFSSSGREPFDTLYSRRAGFRAQSMLSLRSHRPDVFREHESCEWFPVGDSQFPHSSFIVQISSFPSLPHPNSVSDFASIHASAYLTRIKNRNIAFRFLIPFIASTLMLRVFFSSFQSLRCWFYGLPVLSFDYACAPLWIADWVWS
jgi:hypothetical protein